jgi:hypothetical protein
MTMPVFDLAAQLKAGPSLDADATLAMRRAAWPDGKIDPAEAEAIFDLNSTVRDVSSEWVAFFVEALTDYVVTQQSPAGYVDDAKAAWLLAKIDQDGRVGSLGELELLVTVLETATNAPDSLKTYALRQIEAVVQTGSGPTRDGGALDPGCVTAAEAKLLRRILFAQGGDGPAIVSRAEADMLFRIKDKTLDAANAPEWKTLFVQAVGNHLMVASNFVPLSRARASELDAFMNDHSVDVGRFLMRMSKANPLDGVDAIANPGDAPDIDAFADDGVDAGEIDWVARAMNADGRLDVFETALAAFVAEERGTKLV